MEAKQKMEKMDLLTAMGEIVTLAKDSKLSDDFYSKVKPYTDYICEVLEITPPQSVMMSLFLNSSSSQFYISSIAEYLGCQNIEILRFMNEVDELEHRELVRCFRLDRGVHFIIPWEVIECLRQNRNFVRRNISNITCTELFAELEYIFERREVSSLSYEATAEYVKELLRKNKHLNFVQTLNGYKLREDEMLLLVLFCHLFVNNHDHYIRNYDIRFLFDKSRWRHIKVGLCGNSHALQCSKLIEFANNDGMVEEETYKLTKKAKLELLSELNLPMDRITTDGWIKAKDIVEKRLYYDPETRRQVVELQGLLAKDRYEEIRDRLKESGFRSGFACLFYGAPGVGKTETVLQLARETGRDLIQVNVEKIKSKWVGESEVNIKQIFENYRLMAVDNPLPPILLFNEADAIIGKRYEGAEKAVDKMENSLQNILLEEMEKLDGILIATTNLVQNLDKAFERRFLYKVHFIAPTDGVQVQIWQAMFPQLSAEEARWLVSRYKLSGGQIENVVRKYNIYTILNGQSDDKLPILSDYCEAEQLNIKSHPSIGFKTTAPKDVYLRHDTITL